MRAYPEQELDRLISQARFVGDLTDHVLGLAGLQPGMCVLDVGCGTGDVSFLAARRVGPEGTVVGVDCDGDAVARARARAALDNVRFLVDDITRLTLDVPVDALVGRQVLMHLAHPAAVLRHLRRLLAPGALVVFQEIDLTGATSYPRCPLLDATVERIRETLRRTGADVQAGLGLHRIFQDAGLPAPQMILGARVEGGPDALAYAELASATRGLLADMRRTGVAEVDVHTLEARLRAEVVATRATVV